MRVEAMESRIFMSGTPLDGSEVAGLPSDMKTSLYTFVGDHSTSNSEKWSMQVGDRWHSATGYGLVQRDQREFKKGETYPIKLRHDDSNRSEGPDYDYRAWVDRYAAPAWTSGPTTVSGPTYFTTDTGALLQKRWFGENQNATTDKTAYLHIPGIDLDVDSDNDNGFASPTGTLAEDVLEETPSSGKFVFVSGGDFDGDSIPDLADTDGSTGRSFVPVTLNLSANIADAQPSSVTFTFAYNGSDPSQVQQIATGSPDEPHVYKPAPGTLRIWKKNASEARSSSDYIQPGVPVSAASLGIQPGQEITLYVEATAAAASSQLITVSANVSGSRWSGTVQDVIRVRPRAHFLAWNTDERSDKLTAYEIARDGTAITPIPAPGYVGGLGSSALSVDWDDDSTDNGSKPHFYEEGSYNVSVVDTSAEGGFTSTFAIEVVESPNTQSPVGGANDATIYTSFTEFVEDDGGTGSSYFMMAAAAPAAKPPLVTKVGPVPPGYELLAKPRLLADLKAKAAAANQIFVGMYDVVITAIQVPRGLEITMTSKASLYTGFKADPQGNQVNVGGYASAKDTIVALANAQRCPLVDQGNGQFFVDLQDDTKVTVFKDGDWGVTQITRPGEAAVNVYNWDPVKELNLRAPGGRSQNLDRVDFVNDVIVEEKTGTGLLNERNLVDPAAPDPKTAAKKNTEVMWSADQVFNKTKNRILFIKNDATEQLHDHPKYVGPRSVNLPDLNWVKRIRKVVIEVQGDWATFKQAVDADIAKLNVEPALAGYNFSVKYVPATP